jgi:hypothetical protein
MGRKSIFNVPMSPAERQRRSRAINGVTETPMTKDERHDIIMVLRRREKVALAEAEAYQAALLAEFERNGRGENALNVRRAELRRVAQGEAAKRCLVAQAEIKRRTVEMETRIVAASVSSAAAQMLLAEMPTPTQLMPELDLQAIEDIKPPAMTRQERRALLYSSDGDD